MLRWFVAALWLLSFAMPVDAADPETPIYELRIYTCEPGKLAALVERFQDHTLRMFEKHGMKNLAYWTPSDGPAAENTLIYLLQHSSREAADKSWVEFRADPEWRDVAANSEIKHGKILAQSPESIYLKPTDYSPEIGLPRSNRVYEIRTYIAAHGKLDALNARFRNHTNSLFEKHGMHAYGYWDPTDAPKSGNTLIYVLDYPSREAATASWEAFRADPEWQRVVAETQKDGSLTASRPESVFLKLTDFSPQVTE